MKNLRYIFILLCFFSIQKFSAQYDQEIIAFGDRLLSVGKVLKIAEQPKTIDSSFVSREMTYQLIPRRAFSGFKPTLLAPAKVEIKPKAPKLYKAYTKVGIGTFTTPLVQLYYNSLRTRKGAWGFSFDHLSSAGGLNDLPQSRYSDNELELWGRAFLSKHVAKANFAWERNLNHYYGMRIPNDITGNFIPLEDLVPEDEIRQVFNKFGGGVGIGTYHRDSAKVSFDANLNGYFLTDLFKSQEVNVAIDGWVNKREGDFIFELGGDIISNNYRADDNFRFGFLDSIPAVPSQNTIERNYLILAAKPKIRADVGNLQADVGLDVVYENNLSGRGLFYPQAYVAYELFNGLIVPYVHFTGGLKPNSFNSLRTENPFILSNIAFSNGLEDLKNTNNRFDLNGGIKARFSDHLSLSGKVQVQRFKDLPLFVNDTTYSSENRFGVIYDDGRLLGISGEIAYRYNEFLNLVAGIELRDYNMDNEDEAWHRPESKFTMGAVFDYNDKLVAKLDVYFIGKRFVKSLLPIAGENPLSDGSFRTSIDGFVDASLSAEYRYTKRLSAFLELNNITGGKYERWYRFQTQPFQVMGGLTYSF